VRVQFWGTRGSIAKPGLSTIRYGGNTSCVEVRSARGTLVIVDCGNRRTSSWSEADVGGSYGLTRPHPDQPYTLGSHPGHPVFRAAFCCDHSNPLTRPAPGFVLSGAR